MVFNALKHKLRSLISLKGALYIFFAAAVIFVLSVHLDSLFCYQTVPPRTMRYLPMEPGAHYFEELSFLDNPARSVEVLFGRKDEETAGTFHARITDGTDQIVAEWTADASEITANEYKTFELPHTADLRGDNSWWLEVWEEYNPEVSEGLMIYGSLGGENLDQFRITSRWVLLDTNQRDRYKPIYIGLAIFLALLLPAFGDIDQWKWSRMAIIFLAALLFVRIADYAVFSKTVNRVSFQTYQTTDQSDEILPGVEKEYRFTLADSRVHTLEISFDELEKVNVETTLYRLEDGKEYYSSGENQCILDERTRKTGVLLEKGESFPTGHYVLKIRNTGEVPLHLALRNDGTINLQTETRTPVAHLLVMTVLFISVLLLIFLCWCGKKRKKLVYPSMALLLGIIYILLFPLNTYPDASAHFQAAYRYSNILMGQDEWSGRKEDVEFFQEVWRKDMNPSVGIYTAMADHASQVMCKDKSPAEFEPNEKIACYSILNYLPAVLILTLGRLLGLSLVPCLYISRFFTLLLYVAATTHAIRKAPIGKGALAVTALFPLSLMLAGSVSYDSIVIISVICFISSVLRLKVENESKKAFAEAVFWAFMLGAVKGGGYLLLLPMALLICRKDKRSILKTAGVFLVGILSAVLFDVILPTVPMFQLGGEDGMLTASYALQNPIRYLEMTFNSYLRQADDLFFGIGGMLPGQLEYTIPALLIAFLFVGSFLLSGEENRLAGKRDLWVMWIIMGLSLLLTPVMLLSWTPIGKDEIFGLQGRYYLPLFPLFLICLSALVSKGKALASGKRILYEKSGAIIFTTMSLLSLFYLMMKYMTR